MRSGLRGTTREELSVAVAAKVAKAPDTTEGALGLESGMPLTGRSRKGPGALGLRCAGLVRAHHPLLDGWSRTSGAWSPTESIRGGRDHGNGFSSPQGARGWYRRREALESGATTVGTPGRVGPLKLATRIPSSRIESAGANRAGSRERPNSPSWCTSTRHASRCREVLLQRELDARARIRRCVQGPSKLPRKATREIGRASCRERV